MITANEIRPEGLYSVGYVADLLASPACYVRTLIAAGDIDAHRAGGTGRFRITGRSLLRFLGADAHGTLPGAIAPPDAVNAPDALTAGVSR